MNEPKTILRESPSLSGTGASLGVLEYETVTAQQITTYSHPQFISHCGQWLLPRAHHGGQFFSIESRPRSPKSSIPESPEWVIRHSIVTLNTIGTCWTRYMCASA